MLRDLHLRLRLRLRRPLPDTGLRVRQAPLLDMQEAAQAAVRERNCGRIVRQCDDVELRQRGGTRTAPRGKLLLELLLLSPLLLLLLRLLLLLLSLLLLRVLGRLVLRLPDRKRFLWRSDRSLTRQRQELRL